MAEFLSLSDAIAAHVRDGDTVAMEGFTHLIPFAAGHEVIRQRRRDLTLVRMTPDVIYDQLIGAGCVRKLVFSWGGNPGVGSLHRFRDAVENGWPAPLEIEENSHAGMAAAYAAGASNLPFGVLRGYAGTDLADRTESGAWIRCPFTDEELAAVRAIRPGIGLPSVAANLARATHAPGCVLIYESGTIGAKPRVLPLSIGDGELAETADEVVSVPEIFAYWLQGGRIDVGFLGAAQIDRYGNLNSTVIGDYEHPKVRLPGGGGAPEIARHCREILVVLRQTP